MKPAISADGFSTERTSRDRAPRDQAALDAMLARGDVVIQPLVPEIRTNGEISLMFFGGVFSHAVSKRPQAGEFRVQERLGGQIARTDPPPALIERARDLLDVVGAGLALRARRRRGRRRPIRADGSRARRAQPVSRARPASAGRLRARRSSASRNRLRGWSARPRRATAKSREFLAGFRGTPLATHGTYGLPVSGVHDCSHWFTSLRSPLCAAACGSSSPSSPTVVRRRHDLDGRRSRHPVVLAESDDDARRTDRGVEEQRHDRARRDAGRVAVCTPARSTPARPARR